MSQQYPAPGTNPYAQFGQPAPQPEPKKKRKWPWIVGGIVAVGVIAAVANPDSAQEGFENGYNAAPAAPVVDERPTPVPAPPAEPAALPDNGTLRVGTDIAPGTYNAVATGWVGGYWERLTCLSGDFTCIAANDFYTEKGAVGYIEILPTDVAVKVQGVQLTPAQG